ncbi:hypothetical protein EAF04_008392 [Stromatinia cepivora]|nr:hypothetical protein EAF04_008392 [Stromatinia cepivora]
MNLEVSGSDEWRDARIARRDKKAKEIEKAEAIKEAKDKEVRRIKDAIERAYDDAIKFHKALDRAEGASEEEVGETFKMRMSFADMQRMLEVHGPRAE